MNLVVLGAIDVVFALLVSEHGGMAYDLNKPKNVTQLSQRRRYLLVLCSAVYIGATTLFRIRFQFCSLLCRGLSPRKFSCHAPAGRRTVVLPNSKAASNRDREARGTDAHSIV